MANILNGFLNNVLQGATNPGGNLKDYQHAARLFTDDAFRLAPKTKFLYHVVFELSASAQKVVPQLDQRHKNEINMLVKSADLPKFSVQTATKNMYNRKKNLQTSIEYDPVNITFHDDNMGLTTTLMEAYYRYYYRDGNYAAVQPAGAPETGASIEAYNRGSQFNDKQFRYGFDNDSGLPFFDSITISQMARKSYTAFTLINPIISGWQHDTMDNSVSDTVSNTMTLDYETVHYSRGTVGKGGPKGFSEEHYDKTPSPNSLMGGGASSLLGVGGVLAGGMSVLGDISNDGVTFGTVLTAANTLQNAGNLTQGGIGGELLGSAIDTIGKTTGIDVSGVAGVITPNGGGGGGLSTIATAAAVVGGGKLVNDFMNSGASTSSTNTTSANSPGGPRAPAGDIT